MRNIHSNVTRRASPGRVGCAHARSEVFYSTNQSHHWELNQSEVAISVRIANKKPGKKYQSERRIHKETTNRSFFFIFPHFFLILNLFFFPFFFFHYTCLTSNNTKFRTIVVASTGFSFPAILFSISSSYNLIIFYELALFLVICPFLQS